MTSRLFQKTGPTGSSQGAKIPKRGQRQRLPNIGRGVGEIKPANRQAEKHGIRQLLSRPSSSYPGKRVLVTYDVNQLKKVAHVRMLVLNQYTGGRWNYVGFVQVHDIIHLLPYRPDQFGNQIEKRVRDLVLRKTGKSPSRVGKHPSATGPDIIWEYII